MEDTMKRCLLIVTLICVSVALFGAGFALSGVGARGVSMGGAMRGAADDYTTMYWNPAGLAFLPDNQFVLSMASIAPHMKYTPDMNPTGSTGWPGIVDDKEINAKDKVWTFPNFYYVKGATDSPFNYGIGAYASYGLGAEWDVFQQPATMLVDTNNDGTPDTNAPLTWESMDATDFLSSIGIFDIHPAMSYRINDRMSVGAGVSILYGMIEIEKLIPADETNLTYIPTILDMDGDGWGFSGNLGFLYKVTDQLQMGLSGKLPGQMTLKGDAKITTYYSDLINYRLNGVMADTISVSNPDAEATLKLPADIGLGFAYRPLQPLLVTLDVAWTNWACLDKIDVKLNGATNPMYTRWDNTMRYSVGMEYGFGSYIGLDNILGRCGFHYDESPIPDKSINPTWPDVGTKTSYNFGFGLKKGPFGLDAGFEIMTFVDRTVKTTEWVNGKNENLAGKYDTELSALNVGVSYSF
jgi:long-chain fatty acid transport protein